MVASNPSSRSSRGGRRGRTALAAGILGASALAFAAGQAATLNRPGGPADSVGPLPAGALVARAVALPGDRGDLAFSTYLGGLEWDEATGAATDPNGNTLVTGFTLSRDFPSGGTGSHRPGAIVDAFIAKLAADRSKVIWSSRLGGVDMDAASAVTVDRRGNVYIAGRTGSPDWPTRRPLQSELRARQCTGAPCHDAFIAKLRPNGELLWSTYFGGSRNEEAQSIAVDTTGNVYVAGLTDSRNLPVRRALQRTFQSLPCEGDVPCPYDAFVTKLSPRGDRIIYSTYLGGNATDVARSVTVDAHGSAYVVGSSSSPDFPTVAALQSSTRGRACGPPPGEPCPQAFLTKLSPRGSRAQFSTFLGGREADHGHGVAVDRNGRAYVSGSTRSPDFPVRNPVQPRLADEACTEEQPEELCYDGFVSAFTATGSRLRYSTYLGGRATDHGLGVDVTRNGRAMVGGSTDSSDFVTVDAAQPTFGGSVDGFATKLTRRGSISWSTFIGGEEADRASAVALDASGSAHLVGRTLSPDFPTARAVQRSLRDDDYDAFVSVIK